MNFTEKLKRLTEGENRAKLSRSAGLPPTAISNYLVKKQIPRADTAIALARALKVPVQWLIDDRDDEWPPPNPEQTSLPISSFGEEELMREIAIRHRRAVLDFLEISKEAVSIDWERATTEAAKTSIDSPLSEYSQKAFQLLRAFGMKLSRAYYDFDLREYESLHHSKLPGGDMHPNRTHQLALITEALKLHQRPSVHCFLDSVKARIERGDLPQILFVKAGFPVSPAAQFVDESPPRMDRTERSKPAKPGRRKKKNS